MRSTRSRTSLSPTGRGLVGILAASTLLAGCARAPAGPDSPDGPARTVNEARIVDAYDCLAPDPVDRALPPAAGASPDAHRPETPAAGRVPAGFTPTTAVRCEEAPSIEDTEGEWNAVAAVTLAGDLTPLLEALAEPDDRMTLGPCTAEAELVPPLWLVDGSGRAILAHYPRDGCGKTKPGAHTALAGLSVRGTTTQKLTLMVPRIALDSGCPATWAAPSPQEASQTLPPADASSGVVGALPAAPSPMAATVLAEVDGMRWCRYVVESAPPAAADPSEGAGTAGAATSSFGRFAAGGAFDPVTSRSVADAAASAPALRSCDEPATSFLALWPTIGEREVGMPLTVELDGCGLLHNNASTSHTLPPDVLESLTLHTST